MLVVTIQLYSSQSKEITTLGRMVITNDGTSKDRSVGNYDVKLGRKGKLELMKMLHSPQRVGRVEGHRRQALSVWVLVKKALEALKI